MTTPEDANTVAGGSPVERGVGPCAWKCAGCGSTSDCEGALPGDNWCNSCGACDTMRPLYDQAALAMLAGELQALRDHVAHWERGGIDVPAIARADDALRLYHGA